MQKSSNALMNPNQRQFALQQFYQAQETNDFLKWHDTWTPGIDLKVIEEKAISNYIKMFKEELGVDIRVSQEKYKSKRSFSQNFEDFCKYYGDLTKEEYWKKQEKEIELIEQIAKKDLSRAYAARTNQTFVEVQKLKEQVEKLTLEEKVNQTIEQTNNEIKEPLSVQTQEVQKKTEEINALQKRQEEFRSWINQLDKNIMMVYEWEFILNQRSRLPLVQKEEFDLFETNLSKVKKIINQDCNELMKVFRQLNNGFESEIYIELLRKKVENLKFIKFDI